MEQLLKDHELPLKKQKLNEYLNSLNHQPPYGLQHATCIQQIYASMDPIYIQQCLLEFSNVNRHISAFKPVVQSIKESKIRHANSMRYGVTDPPVLQNPERVVLMSESERFERTYQPNVALAPRTPKKYQYSTVKAEEASPKSTVKEEAEEPRKTPEKVIDSAVSVVQSTSTLPKYNPEIELSTDTEDSASETSEKQQDAGKLEEALRSVEAGVRDKVLELFKNLSKEYERAVQEIRVKDNRIGDLEAANAELLKELEAARSRRAAEEQPEIVEDGGEECKDNNSSSIIVANESSSAAETQKSVIASLVDQKEAIIKTAPE